MSDESYLSMLGWIGTTIGGFLLGASISGADHTIAAALFYVVAVIAFAARTVLSRPALTTGERQ